ncbi:alpha/beta hydrolase [Cognatiyoonia sp. IB215182]|uniref:alpha/beta fold hydrolase n=1 Tax=Cognatiyoonia sp. IB215182 TaxID=3097353 RepID=UPI002A0DA000|nr:alpha/beta hydrolase [Cognatiyoonia sp. IB215182]MDX8354590.1 alpha/beta hydrolase [Cognatiyoonia sp. IB215182]
MPDISGHAVHAVTVGTGAPVIMVHCALARHDRLLPLAGAIGGHVTLFDMPGHGKSADWDGKTEYQGLVADAAAALCDGPTHLIGHSFGATAMLRLAVTRPDLVSRLTLIEPVYFAAAKRMPEHNQHAKAFRPFVMAMLAGDEARAAEVFNSLWGATPWEDVPARLRTYLIARIHLIVAGAAAIEEDADGIISAERLGALDIPVTLIRGADSQPVISAIHQRLVGRIPQARDHVVPGAAHMLPLTHTEEVAKIIRAADRETA